MRAVSPDIEPRPGLAATTLTSFNRAFTSPGRPALCGSLARAPRSRTLSEAMSALEDPRSGRIVSHHHREGSSSEGFSCPRPLPNLNRGFQFKKQEADISGDGCFV